jgi:predicted tellurium resistance membrane protein TerC
VHEAHILAPVAWLSDPEAWTALAALLALEIVLGVDNVIFISILASKLPAEVQDRARRMGLLAAGAMRLLLLLAIGWIVTLKRELFRKVQTVLKTSSKIMKPDYSIAQMTAALEVVPRLFTGLCDILYLG